MWIKLLIEWLGRYTEKQIIQLPAILYKTDNNWEVM